MIAFEAMPQVDAVVISHDHYDHLDHRTIEAMRDWKTTFVVPLGIGALLVSFLWRNDAFRETARYSLQGLALTPIFICAIVWPTFGPFRLLNTRLLAFLGVLSYSLYLTHHVILFGVHHHLPQLHPVLQAAIGAALAVGISWGIYLAVEKPCAALRKRLNA